MRSPNLKGIDYDLNPFPLDVIVETSSYCNMRCIMCPYSTLKRPKGEMDFNIFKKIIDEMARESPQSRLWIAIMGEPLLRGDGLVEMLRYAKKQKIENIHVNTNGTYLTEQMTHKLLSCGIKELLVSMDAFTKETYDRIRIGGDFHSTVNNVEYFLHAKKTGGENKPTVIMQFITMNENEHEAEDFKAFWLERNAVVKIRLKMGWGRAIKTEDLDAANIERNKPCSWLLRSVSIHWDGRFAQCDADHEAIYSPGDIKTQTIKEVWEGELAKRREKHWALDFSHPLCSTCKDWSVGRAHFYYPPQE